MFSKTICSGFIGAWGLCVHRLECLCRFIDPLSRETARKDEQCVLNKIKERDVSVCAFFLSLSKLFESKQVNRSPGWVLRHWKWSQWADECSWWGLIASSYKNFPHPFSPPSASALQYQQLRKCGGNAVGKEIRFLDVHSHTLARMSLGWSNSAGFALNDLWNISLATESESSGVKLNLIYSVFIDWQELTSKVFSMYISSFTRSRRISWFCRTKVM